MNNDVTDGGACACLETLEYLRAKCRFEAESRDGFSEAERIVQEFLDDKKEQ